MRAHGVEAKVLLETKHVREENFLVEAEGGEEFEGVEALDVADGEGRVDTPGDLGTRVRLVWDLVEEMEGERQGDGRGYEGHARAAAVSGERRSRSRGAGVRTSWTVRSWRGRRREEAPLGGRGHASTERAPGRVRGREHSDLMPESPPPLLPLAVSPNPCTARLTTNPHSRSRAEVPEFQHGRNGVDGFVSKFRNRGRISSLEARGQSWLLGTEIGEPFRRPLSEELVE